MKDSTATYKRKPGQTKLEPMRKRLLGNHSHHGAVGRQLAVLPQLHALFSPAVQVLANSTNTNWQCHLVMSTEANFVTTPRNHVSLEWGLTRRNLCGVVNQGQVLTEAAFP